MCNAGGMEMVLSLTELGQQLNNGQVSHLYLLYGEEAYLKEYYRDTIIEEAMKQTGNSLEVVTVEKNISVSDLQELTDTFSMFHTAKVIIVRNSGWFKGNAAESVLEQFGFMTEDPGDNYVIFLEEAAAKNRKMYKAIEKNGVCVELPLQTGAYKEKWIAAQFAKKGMRVDGSVCRYMAENCEPDFMNLHQEIEKLCLMKAPGENVTRQDVDAVCVKVLHSKIFALTDHITGKNAKGAFAVARDLMAMGEPVERIYFMVARYFRLMKQAKELVGSGESDNAATILKISPYEATQFVKNSSRFSLDVLKEAEAECLAYDVAMKNGEANLESALEILITKYSNRK